MNTQTDLPPDTAPFDLRLARDFGWPLRTRDGQKVRLGIWHAPGVWALAGYLESISDEMCSWRKDGCYLVEEGSEFDLLIDLSDSPQYRAAVKRAYAAGWRVFVRGRGTAPWVEGCGLPVTWDWRNFAYRLAVHVQPARAAKGVPWDCAEDVPGPVCWLKDNGNNSGCGALVIEITADGVYVNRSRSMWTWSQIENLFHSTDRKTWLPCVKGAAV
jgi:hypothetical protein